ncbi:UNVERIFIED_ORG: hypothetical protein M2414_005432 [Rahnella aquatilis]
MKTMMITDRKTMNADGSQTHTLAQRTKSGPRGLSGGLLLLALWGLTAQGARAAVHEKLQSPAEGVVCDAYFCADRWGVSDGLTAQFLGEEKASALTARGEFERSAFSFADGIYCDVSAQVCRKSGAVGEDGKPSGPADPTTTHLLFEGE